MLLKGCYSAFFISLLRMLCHCWKRRQHCFYKGC
uniref:Uncharacterized protein n=1 Tax=Arundo donax TaxID=35708 RepID=A0A0A9AQH8_ARUDO